ncbi:unnamed protein product [Heligmosomoides polygyrus]|uniref:General stress protein n=1 Tax=Heligmosomoides polygyrus TaxID=6339 RepID=A0A183GMI8_HELPZ|nr:unnamed protein product [Heligmosomoides polygyrus]
MSEANDSSVRRVYNAASMAGNQEPASRVQESGRDDALHRKWPEEASGEWRRNSFAGTGNCETSGGHRARDE